MFLIGETKRKVRTGKLELPKEYKLKKRKVIAKWKDDVTLYLSDSEKSLNYIAGRENEIFEMEVSTENKVRLSRAYDGYEVTITGCVTTVELKFQKVKEEMHV